MKNQDYSLTEEQETTDIEQFQDHHSGLEKFELDIENSNNIEPDPRDEDDDSEYSDDELEFADGEGTLLSEEFDEEDSEVE